LSVNSIVNSILAQKETSKTRKEEAYLNFFEKFKKSHDLIIKIESIVDDTNLVQEAYKQFIVSLVTAMEIYFKDLLKELFKKCKSDIMYERCKLIKLGNKFSFIEIVQFYQNNIDIEDIICEYFNFQNLECIDEVFSCICNFKIFQEIKGKEFILPNRKNMKIFLENDFYKNIAETLEMRHKIIHDIDNLMIIKKTKVSMSIAYVLNFILAFDITIKEKFILENKK